MAGLTITSSHNGQGVFGTQARNRGEEVCKVLGPMIDFRAAVAKGERECDALQIDADQYVDLADPLRSVNHSCDPNCGLRDGNRLITLRDLNAGEEITYDYSTTMDEGHWTLACHCGAGNCRGVVQDFCTLPPETQARYFRLRVVMPFIEKKYQQQHRP